MTLLFLDHREDSISVGNFFIIMTGYPDQPELVQFVWDMPASYHNGAGSLSFADGHAEMRKWRDPRTVPPLRKYYWMSVVIPSPYNRDIVWLQERATRRM